MTAASIAVIIPGSVNYFYDQLGRRVAQTLESLGYRTIVRALADLPDANYDLCLLSNVYEVGHGYGDHAAAADRIRELVRQTGGRVVAMGMESVSTGWFDHILTTCDRAGIDLVLDFGVIDQSLGLTADVRSRYRFVLNGLTPSEKDRVAQTANLNDSRPFPWAFVGHQTADRTALVDYLVQHLDPAGFVYLPTLSPCTERRSPHLNQRQYEAVLGRTRYQLWCTHHEAFYVEGERFRASLLTGGVGVKVLGPGVEVPPDTPFRDLMLDAIEIPERLTPEEFPKLRRQFVRDFMSMPSLADTLLPVVAELGVRPETVPFQRSIRAA